MPGFTPITVAEMVKAAPDLFCMSTPVEPSIPEQSEAPLASQPGKASAA